MPVPQPPNVQHVPIHIIQQIAEQAVHYVHQNIVPHVMHQLVCVQDVKVDIICQVEVVLNVQIR